MSSAKTNRLIIVFSIWNPFSDMFFCSFRLFFPIPDWKTQAKVNPPDEGQSVFETDLRSSLVFFCILAKVSLIHKEIRFMILVGIWNSFNMFNSDSRCMESYALMQSTKIRCRFLLNSQDFSVSCLSTNIWSTVEGPDRNPYWYIHPHYSLLKVVFVWVSIKREFCTQGWAAQCLDSCCSSGGRFLFVL